MQLDREDCCSGVPAVAVSRVVMAFVYVFILTHHRTNLTLGSLFIRSIQDTLQQTCSTRYNQPNISQWFNIVLYHRETVLKDEMLALIGPTAEIQDRNIIESNRRCLDYYEHAVEYEY